MSVQQGRIGGPLLADNLVRNGTNLAFDNKVLYIDVVNKRIGFNTASPVNDLYVPTAIDTVNLTVDTTADIGNFVVSGSTVQYVLGNSITISPSQNINPRIITPGLSTANLYLYSNTLSNTVTNNSVNFSPNGTGSISLANDSGNVQTTVNGSLHATGNITFDGSITLGTSTSNRITITAEVASNIVPVGIVSQSAQNVISQSSPLFTGVDDESLLYIGTSYEWDLGSNALQWSNLYLTTLTVGQTTSGPLALTTATFGNINFTGNTISDSIGDINFSTAGTGSVRINGADFFSTANTFKVASNMSLAVTGQGYYKFAGTNGVAVPVGTNLNRPASPVEGTVRYDTTLAYVEVYSSSQGWIPAYGQNANATVQDVSDASTLYSIVFGY